ncbi:substrate-binding periplasmic protein [Roseateles chitosanitabidus]|jgi:polar amino acid transport system substrate-binding protein|uniref:substrate-binding periplasmic protein n=1 Tax=Roseateles chitosanitabidus TaxID=65048 RepID=UPI0008350C4D|nr:transporter substrate-binding domain-containing protein [Roseateles chitosanitabidus]
MHRRHLTLAGLAWMSGASAAGRATPASLITALPPVAPGMAPSAGPAQVPASLRLLSEEFPPVNFSEGGHPRGLAVDIVQAIQQRLGQSLPIEFMPWARAFREAQDNQPTALFATARIPEREALFQWVGPIVQFQSTFYARADSRLRLRSLEEARRLQKVLVVRDWYTLVQLQSAGFHNLQQISDPVQGVRMLQAGRAPVFAAERITMPQTLAQAGLSPKAVKALFSFASSDGYIAFSRSTPASTVAAWQAQLAELKRDGSFAALHKRWFPTDTASR